MWNRGGDLLMAFMLFRFPAQCLDWIGSWSGTCRLQRFQLQFAGLRLRSFVGSLIVTDSLCCLSHLLGFRELCASWSCLQFLDVGGVSMVHRWLRWCLQFMHGCLRLGTYRCGVFGFSSSQMLTSGIWSSRHFSSCSRFICFSFMMTCLGFQGSSWPSWCLWKALFLFELENISLLLSGCDIAHFETLAFSFVWFWP